MFWGSLVWQRETMVPIAARSSRRRKEIPAGSLTSTGAPWSTARAPRMMARRRPGGKAPSGGGWAAAGSGQIREQIARPHRGKLVRVPHQNQTASAGQGGQQGLHEDKVHHGGLVQNVGVQRLPVRCGRR